MSSRLGKTKKSSILSPPQARSEDVAVPRHAREAIAALQKEVLLLRNELNIELFLRREAVQHIGTLVDTRIAEDGAEKERQGLVGETIYRLSFAS